ncbi:hypothetical protein ACV3RU_06880 [Clostridium perfringens]|nr:hypothetical protein [Clostridium perfringens]
MNNKFITYDENNLLINKIYQKDNYVIKSNEKGEKGVCYIFFSSNGLYNANDEKSFEKNIIEKDRYEWINLSSSICVEKEIYIRDIWLSWYVKGINSKISSIDKLIEWLREETYGFKVKIIGMSSGAYIGTLIGSILKAELCLSFSGQFSLNNHNNHVKDNNLLKKYYNSRGGWYDIYELVGQSKINIVYFFPEYVMHDKIQSEYVKNYENVLSISFNSNIHAKTIFSYDYPKVLKMNIKEFRILLENMKKTPISAFEFSYKINGKYRAIILFLKKAINKIKTKLMFN